MREAKVVIHDQAGFGGKTLIYPELLCLVMRAAFYLYYKLGPVFGVYLTQVDIYFKTISDCVDFVLKIELPGMTTPL